MTLGQSVKQTNTEENGYGRDITVGSKSESIDKGHYYMPKFGFDFNISSKQYLGIEWSGNYSKDYANDSYQKDTKVSNVRKYVSWKTDVVLPLFLLKSSLSLFMAASFGADSTCIGFSVGQNRGTYMSQMCIKLA